MLAVAYANVCVNTNHTHSTSMYVCTRIHTPIKHQCMCVSVYTNTYTHSTSMYVCTRIHTPIQQQCMCVHEYIHPYMTMTRMGSFPRCVSLSRDGGGRRRRWEWWWRRGSREDLFVWGGYDADASKCKKKG